MIPLDQIREFLRFLTIPFLNFNFIDIAIILVVVVYAIEGYALGFIKGFADFLSFVLSFLFGLTFYNVFGDALVTYLNIPKGFGNALGFFIGAFICEIVLTIIFRTALIPFILRKLESLEYPKQFERVTGIIPGVFSAIVLMAFVLTMIVSLPLSPFLKNSVSASKIGEPLVSNIQGFDKKINNVFGGAVSDALTFLTVEPKSDELLQLNFSTSNVKVDRASELEMLALLNKEREKAGLDSVREDPSLREVARSHCKDMLNRGYFSHYTPEGKTPFDRMAENDIDFQYAGENIALAPNTKLAMQGFINSPGHKANMLSKNFGTVGIGVIDGGIYGEMFCQEFTD